MSVDLKSFGIEIGEANYSGQGAKNFSLEAEKDNIFRILPPLGSLAAKGVWAVDYAVHWGYKTSDKKHRLFICIQEKDQQTKMVTKRCPECDHVARLKADLEKKKNDGIEILMKKGASKEQAEKVVKEKLTLYAETARRFNRSFKFYMNVLNNKNEIGVLGISYAHFKLLRKEIAELRNQGVDPLHPFQGAWFNFTFEGKDGHAVKPVTIGTMAEGNVRLRPAALTEDILKQLKNAAGDLTNLFKSITEEQIARLAASDGNPEVVDAVFSRGTVTKTESVDVGGGGNFDDVDLGFGPPPSQEAAPQTAPQTQAQPAPQAAAPATQAAPAPQTTAPLSPPDIGVNDKDFDSLFKDL